MSKHTLNRPEIGPSLQQMRGKGVAERMGAHRLGNASLCGQVPDNVKYHDPGQRSAPSLAHKQV